MKFYILILTITFFPMFLFSQDKIEHERNTNDQSSENNRKQQLSDGFYSVTPVYPWNRKIPKTIVVRTSYAYIVHKKGFWLFKKEIKKDSIKINVMKEIEVDTVYEFDFTLLKTDKRYNIIPEAIAAKSNILQIYNSQFNDIDSVMNQGLTFKFSGVALDSIYNVPNTKKSGCHIGLVIDSKLVGVFSYYKDKNLQNGKANTKYLSFNFSNLNSRDIENIYTALKPNPYKFVK